jgi:alpha-galactosidase
MVAMPRNALFSLWCSESEARLLDRGSPAWEQVQTVPIDHYWDGRLARRADAASLNSTSVKSLWNEAALFFYFVCGFDSLTVNSAWPKDQPVIGLWDKDVVEVFVKPAACSGYFEVEVSPLGQWVDLRVLTPRVDVDFGWRSELRTRVDVFHEARLWSVMLALPWAPMSAAGGASIQPRAGDIWRLNLFRMAGEGADREYLAWCPTFTTSPDFHVPDAFGNLIFVES